MSGKKYQLKDQETGFFDAQSGLNVTREQIIEIDTSKGAGKATMRMIKTGGLIEVNSSSKAAETGDGEPETGDKNKSKKHEK